MALTIGTDTYISLADADTYLSEHYVSTDAKLTAWTALSDPDKETLLRRAAQVIDRTPVVGLKAGSTQAMQFPRTVYTKAKVDVLFNFKRSPSSDWYIQPEVPDAVKYAQCEIALSLLSPSTRTQMQREGVKSFSLDGLSENYGSGRMNSLPYEARELLAPYLAGSVSIC